MSKMSKSSSWIVGHMNTTATCIDDEISNIRGHPFTVLRSQNFGDFGPHPSLFTIWADLQY